MKHTSNQSMRYGPMKRMGTFTLLALAAVLMTVICASGMASAADSRGGSRSGRSYRDGGQSGRSYTGSGQSRGSYRGSSRSGRSYGGRTPSGHSYRGGYSGRYYRGDHYGRYYRGGRYYGGGGYYWGGYGSLYWNPWWWYDPFYYPYYYSSNYPYYGPYYNPYPYVTPSVPQEYIERPEVEAPPEPSDVYYYCPESGKYYPYVRECPGGWQTVPARPPSPPAAEQPTAKVIDRMTLRVNFDVDKAVIRPEDREKLDKAVDFVKKYPDAKIEIDGYTDNSGTAAYNEKLSERRAEAVKGYLVEEAGVDPSRISAIGRGQSDPVADNSTEEGRFENRRVEILILQK
jgi:outer membrane protein OmpA-like peptidoglycan-associated protein